jgi:hypothetical protein
LEALLEFPAIWKQYLEFPELHLDLEAKKCVGAKGRELQEAADGHQLAPGHVVQRDLILNRENKL